MSNITKTYDAKADMEQRQMNRHCWYTILRRNAYGIHVNNKAREGREEGVETWNRGSVSSLHGLYDKESSPEIEGCASVQVHQNQDRFSGRLSRRWLLTNGERVHIERYLTNRKGIIDSVFDAILRSFHATCITC